MAIPAGPAALSLLAALLFGLALVLTQPGLRHASPSQGALISIPTSTALFWILSPRTVDWSQWEPRAAAIFAAVGLLFPASVTLLTFEANRRMGPSVSGALGNLAPVFAVLLALVLFHEVPRLGQTVGIVTIIGGVLLLSVDRRWLDTSWPYWAAGLPLAAAAIRGIIQPLAKLGLALWPSPSAAVLLGYSVSCLVVVSAARTRKGDGTGRPSPAGVLWFALVGICNGGAVLALYAALARGPVFLVSPLVATYPLVTLVVTALFWRRRRWQWNVVLGVILTVGGVALLLRL